ncbi:Uncharacterized protein FWK35_00034363 [Aphis craccivora]|uniref:Uncharacterized protein n=1 Tax=Aphis craccivora TaxID=307492 RepID=A0A6G0YWT9_APHCR|nr:Uncharacterized protein FWK35_00034363 [Aphis craccivora]
MYIVTTECNGGREAHWTWWRQGECDKDSGGHEDGGILRVGELRRVCFPLDAKRKRQGSTAWNVSGARTHKKNGRQNPRASYFTVCQAVRGFYNITDKHLAKKNCAHQNGSAATSSVPADIIIRYIYYICVHIYTSTAPLLL